MTQLPQLHNLNIHLPDISTIFIPVGSFSRLTDFSLLCKSMAVLSELWRAATFSNLTRAAVALVTQGINDQDVGLFFRSIARNSPNVTQLTVHFSLVLPPDTLTNLRLPSLRCLSIWPPKLTADGYAVLRTAGGMWPSLEGLSLSCEADTNGLLHVSMCLPKLEDLNIHLPAPSTLERVGLSQPFAVSIESHRAVWSSHTLTLITSCQHLGRYRGSSLDTLAK